jgi:NAD(P)-dependent dehydrogenase (short-subunit alcohol dehydrogenase family)
MKLLVLGATGRTGRHVTRQALARGHDVTAVVRDAMSIPPHDRLRLATANPLDADALADLLLGQDAVISCLGQRTRARAGLLRNAVAAMLRAMSRAEMRRYLVVSQGLLFPLRRLFAAVLRRMLARYIADSTARKRLVPQVQLRGQLYARLDCWMAVPRRAIASKSEPCPSDQGPCSTSI